MVNNLVSVNSTLTTQIAKLTHNITEKDMELTALRKIIEELTVLMKTFNINSAGFTPGQRSAGRGNVADQGRQSGREQGRQATNSLGYCHSRG
eukprot:5752537-Ditylum_brightwellii.AAC.1